MPKTASEQLFETFCAHHRLDCQRIAETSASTPDYHVRLGSTAVAVEIKQIESRRGVDPDGGWSRTIGWHVRQKIAEARAQLRVAASAGMPAILLIHNTVDPMHLFGTEQHDFLSAMYGELTVESMRLAVRQAVFSTGAMRAYGRLRTRLSAAWGTCTQRAQVRR